MGSRDGFGGIIGRYRADSTPWWPDANRPPQGAPNVMIVVLDDVGFAQIGCFGSDIDTPHLDGLAARGLRFSNFHTTALCSPTRACVLTWGNDHRVGMGRITDMATGFPGYDAYIPPSAGFISEVLRDSGYATYAVGKWHLTPDEETHLGASRRTWPLGRGFDRYYGFLHGETHQFFPSLVHDNHRVPAPRAHADGYHLTEDLADRAIEFVGDLRHVDADQPFFLWFAPGACHSPHQAPRDWIDRYRGHFDGGWDRWRDEIVDRQRRSGLLAADVELSARPDWVPAWDSLSDDERRLYARYMECFAGFLSHADDQIGRVLSFLERTGDLDRTLVIALSDNGASSEGGPTGSVNDARPWNLAERPVAEALERIEEIGGPWIHNNYPWGWTVAGNTPFRRWKREVHEGGVCDPLIISWPNGIAARGEVRRQYAHAVDLAPTVYDLVGVEAPDEIGGVPQLSLDGVSLRPTIEAADAAEVRDTQYYEMFGCRAVYHRGYKAVTYVSMMAGDIASDDDPWELYHVASDPSECHDLAGGEPDLLADMVARWWDQAERNQVLPIDSMPFFEAVSRPGPLTPRTVHVYWPGTGPVEETAAVNVRSRSHTVSAEIDHAAGDHGVLVSQGSGYGGWVLRIDDDGRPRYAHNFVGLEWSDVTGPDALTAGRHRICVRYEHAPDPGALGGTVTLLVDDEPVGHTVIPRATLTRFSICGDGLTVGYSMSLPVDRTYRSPAHYTGSIDHVAVTADADGHTDARAEAEQALRTQ